jgi:hypothetical protein
MAAQFRSNLWDPVLIVSQIIAIQCTYYVGLGIWILIFDFWMGSVHSLHQIFSDKVANTSQCDMSAYFVGFKSQLF